MNAPKWLNRQAKVYWRKLSPLVEPSPANEDQLALLCDSWATYRQAAKIIESEGITFTTSTGIVRPHPANAIKQVAANQIQKLTKALGLDGATELDELDELMGDI